MILLNAQLKAMPHDTEWPLRASPLLFFDLETTGLRPDRGARITEIAVLDRDAFRLYWTRDTASTDIGAVLPVLIELLTQGIVVGHHLAFDFRFVAYEAERHGRGGLALQYIDTLALARSVLGARLPDAQLRTCCNHMQCTPSDSTFHTARGDVKATRALFWALVEAGDLHTVSDAGIQRMQWMV